MENRQCLTILNFEEAGKLPQNNWVDLGQEICHCLIDMPRYIINYALLKHSFRKVRRKKYINTYI